MEYRQCKHRYSQQGVFQCARHVFMHLQSETYDKVHAICLDAIPRRFCSYLDFGFNLQEDPSVRLNCTHTFFSRPLGSVSECRGCEYQDPDPEGLERS